MFGAGYAEAHSDLVAAMMLTAAINFTTVLLADALEHVAAALLAPEDDGAGIMRTPELVVPR